MSELQIIYTPEADNLRLSDIEMIGPRQPGDPLLKNLRDNYQKLRGKITDLPSKVGIVTYEFLFKQYSREMLEEVKSSQLINSTTNYILLDVFREALNLRNENYLDNALAENMVYRNMMYLMSHECVCLDRELISKKAVFFSSTISSAERVIGGFNQSLEKLKELDEGGKLTSSIENITEKLKEIYPNFNQLEEVHQEIKKRLKANKVSESFPLYFLHRDYFFASMYSVSLAEKIETPDYLPRFLEYIKEGCKASGLNEIPENVKKMIIVGQKDRFGETKRINTLNELLDKLPNPKTIITDMYIVDRFPELAKIGFDSYEFKLD